MAANIELFPFVLMALAVWRISHLISKEDGPFDIIFIIRKKAGKGFWAKLMDCFYCTSVWVALPFGIWLGTTWQERLLSWIALSGAACLAEQATTRKESKVAEYEED